MDKAKTSTRRVTIKDVAREAGVSKSTVSLVLKNSPSVSEETARHVREACERLGYVYNRSAANLRTRRSNIVGIIISDISNPFFSELFTAIENEFESAGVVVMMANTSESRERQRRAVATLLEHNVDGLFISPVKYSPPDDLQLLEQTSVPSIFINRYITDLPCNYVGSDNIVGSEMATERLLAAGHRRIAFIGGGVGSTARIERLEGYTRAFSKRNVTPAGELITETDSTRRGGYDAIRELVGRTDPPTAAFCYNDIVALGVLLGLQSVGKRPGEDFAVIGFDDVSEASLWSPSLSTVSITPEAVAKRACRLMVEKWSNPGNPERVLLVPRLAIRESCGTREGALTNG